MTFQKLVLSKGFYLLYYYLFLNSSFEFENILVHIIKKMLFVCIRLVLENANP
jgi:hypothetical protein